MPTMEFRRVAGNTSPTRERGTDSAGAAQSFRPPARGRGSDGRWRRAWVVVNRFVPLHRAGGAMPARGHPDDDLRLRLSQPAGRRDGREHGDRHEADGLRL